MSTLSGNLESQEQGTNDPNTLVQLPFSHDSGDEPAAPNGHLNFTSREVVKPSVDEVAPETIFDQGAGQKLDISWLPVELLFEIFLIYQALFLVTRDRFVPPIQRPSQPYAWLRITHVCHHWRNVALSSTLLWTTIYITPRSECIETMVTRSKDSPLYVQATTDIWPLLPSEIRKFECSFLPSLKCALRELHRIRTLKLTLPNHTHHKLSKLLSAPAPLLQWISLINADQCINTRRPTLPFQFNVSQLKMLDLWRYDFPLANAIIRPSLTYLIVEDCHGCQPTKPAPIQDILAAVALLPSLTFLRLGNIFHDASSHLPARPRRVVLSQLDGICLIGSAPSCTWFINQLDFPATAIVHTHCDKLDDISDIPSLTRAVTTATVTKWESEVRAGIRAAGPTRNEHVITFGLNVNKLVSFDSWGDILPFTFTPHMQKTFGADTRPFPGLRVAVPPSPNVTSAFDTMSQVMPVSGARALQLLDMGKRVDWSELYQTVVSRFGGNKLKILAVENWEAKNLADLLVQAPPPQEISEEINEVGGEEGEGEDEWEDEDEVSTTDPAFSRLSVVFAEGLRFDKYSKESADEVSGVEQLRRALLDRRKQGVEVAELALIKCVNFSAEDARLLRDAVGALHWDRVVQETKSAV